MVRSDDDVLRPGDRVRVLQPETVYTGCRGTVVEDPAALPTPLGHYVAIDGENGTARPFLAQHLERMRPARVRTAGARSVERTRAERGRR